MTRNQFIVGLAKALQNQTDQRIQPLDGFLVVESRNRVGVWGPAGPIGSSEMICISVWGDDRSQGLDRCPEGTSTTYRIA